MVLRIETGKGTQAPKIKEKYCICHLVSSPALALEEFGWMRFN